MSSAEARPGGTGVGWVMAAIVVAAIGFYVFFSGSDEFEGAEWQESADEICSVVQQVTHGVIDQRNRGVRTEAAIMLQVSAASLDWPEALRPFVLEMAEDVVRASGSHSPSSLLKFSWRHCQETLRARTR